LVSPRQAEAQDSTEFAGRGQAQVALAAQKTGEAARVDPGRLPELGEASPGGADRLAKLFD
jgi:hypothetical protein